MAGPATPGPAPTPPRPAKPSRLPQIWLRRGLAAWLMLPVAALFGALVGVRRGLYQLGLLKSARLPVKVVVVGNVVAGGAGKTPVVMAVVRHLQARGLRVGVVSRGYGRRPAPTGPAATGQTGDCLEVHADTPAALSGDEPALLARSLSAPVFVATRRLDAARALLARYPDTQCLVCDDGLQHYALQRDVDICVFDARGVGNGWWLPAGPLRESWPRAPLALGGHAPAACLVLAPAAMPVAAASGRPNGRPASFQVTRQLADEAVNAAGQQTPLASLRGKALFAVAAIAQPEQFFNMLRAQGLTLAQTQALPDHYDFESWVCPFHEGQTLICTEKDAVKLWSRYPTALAVPLAVQLEPAFWAELDSAMDSATDCALKAST